MPSCPLLNTAVNGKGCRGDLDTGTASTCALTAGQGKGVYWTQVFQALQESDVINIQVDPISLDSTAVKVHPDGAGALKKTLLNSIGKSRGGWTTKAHRVAAGYNRAVAFSLSPGQGGDAPEGCRLLNPLKNCGWDGARVIMDKAYEGDETRQRVFDLGMEPVVPPKRDRPDGMGVRSGSCTKREMKWRGCFAGSRVSAEFSRALTNWMSFSSFSFILH